MFRIAIVDDHILFRKSLKLLITSFENMKVVVEASNGKELLEVLETVSVDILLLDLQMPEMDGFETCRKINELYPDIKVLVLTLRDDAKTIREVVELGVQGYFTKNTDPSELENAILKLSNDGFYFEKSLTSIIQHILEGSSPKLKTEKSQIFSDREMEIVRLTLKELSGSEVGVKLSISPKTVEKHKRNLMEKVGSKNFIGVITYALLHNLLSVNELKD
ncbi:response regulator transcription factor [Flavobacterium sp.]|uniref:response regulator transcription factor n=1 Tax=Flavobacterium sp. TaxID=239 RepID=UPI0025C535DE|nr:response regulator transcription factor [Flavobacterium sp.]MBA4153720.1 DNA-binding response regulator [Flavobacterium sp.]MDP2160375.1 response regulator transcription factor [Flavobacterium sp.]